MSELHVLSVVAVVLVAPAPANPPAPSPPAAVTSFTIEMTSRKWCEKAAAEYRAASTPTLVYYPVCVTR